MEKLKSEKGGVLVLTLMTTIILSILGLAMLPLTVMEYKSSHHFSDFEKAYYIAEAGTEEAIAELNHNWDYSGNLGENFSEGEYDINVSGTGNSRTITATGKIGNIQRTIEANIERAVTNFDLSEMKDFAIFSQGDLEIDELGNINGGIIGAHGNLHFESAKEDGSAQLLVEGEVLPNHEDDHNNNINYNDANFPLVTDRNLMDLSSFNMDVYIEWLKTNFTVTEFDRPLSGANTFDLGEDSYPNEATSILIIDNYEEVSFSKGTFYGLIIVNHTDKLKIHNESTINGMIIFTGNDLEITEFQISGSKIDVNGSLICTNSATQKGNWKLKLNHDPEILSNLDAYLPENFEIPSESDISINVLNWKEIN